MTPRSAGTPGNIIVIYTPLKSTLMGYNSAADNVGLFLSIYPLLVPKFATSREIPEKN